MNECRGRFFVIFAEVTARGVPAGYYPAAGLRYYDGRAMTNVSANGYLWLSGWIAYTGGSILGRNLAFASGLVEQSTYGPCWPGSAYSVRCLQAFTSHSTDMKNYLKIACLLALLLVAACSTERALPRDAQIERRIGALLKKMSLEEKVGQMTQLTLDVVVSRGDKKAASFGRPASRPVRVREIEETPHRRVMLSGGEVNRVLGGGLVEGSLILLGGEPGIGKSTLALQLALGSKGLTTLYVSGEESPQQIKMRADRLGESGGECLVFTETLLEDIIAQAEEHRPDVVVIDSIQTIYSAAIDSSPGSVSQVRECASMLLKYAKTTGTSVVIIGHITKDGSIAGPKILEHIVDVVLQFEGDSNNVYRILRGIKNRFGATFEIGVFEMRGEGLAEVDNPSEILLSHYDEPLSGIAVGAAADGIRPYLIEVQALVGNAAYGTPQRSATGYDFRRLNMLLAVLEKRVGMKMFSKDVFLNFAGGFKVSDTGLDLAVVSAVISSYFDRPVAEGVCCAGEIGLSGEIRPAPRTMQRISEAARLGFRKIIVSGYFKDSSPLPKGIEVVRVNRIDQLPRALFGSIDD